MSGGIVWLASYPKSGNTWMRILLQNLEAETDADASPAEINGLTFGMVASVRGWLDDILGFSTGDLSDDESEALRPDAYDWAAPSVDPPIYLKIHDAYRLVGKGIPLVGRRVPQRALYLVRNPLDVVLSYSNHLSRSIDATIEVMGDPEHTLAASSRALRRQVRQKLLTWSQHVASWIDAPQVSVHVVKYESLLTDPVATLRDAVRFLGWPHTEQALELAVSRSDFERLRQQERELGFEERRPAWQYSSAAAVAANGGTA